MTQPAEQPSITCPKCQRTSHHPEDVRSGYCGGCHEFTSAPFGARPVDPDWMTPGPDTPGHRAHLLRRVYTGITDGFDMTDGGIPDSMTRMVAVGFFPVGMPDTHGLHAVMTADQAEAFGKSLLVDADRARRP